MPKLNDSIPFTDQIINQYNSKVITSTTSPCRPVISV